MAYDPADLKLPPWLLRVLDITVKRNIPIWFKWRVGCTRPGILYLSVLTGVIGAAFYSGNNLLYLCAAALASLAMMALSIGITLLRHITIPEGLMPDTGTVDSVIAMRRIFPCSCKYSASVNVAWSRQGGGSVHGHLRLDVASESLMTGRITAGSRALHNFQHVSLTTEAPLGWWRLQHTRSCNWQWAILPRPLPYAMGNHHDAEHNHRATHHIEGDEWQDLRAYTHGDTPSRIHWRKSASGPWAVKRFAQHTSENSKELLRVDLRGAPGSKFEHLLAQAYGWIQAHPSGEVILGQQRFMLNQEEDMHRIHHALASVQPEMLPPRGDRGLLMRQA